MTGTGPKLLTGLAFFISTLCLGQPNPEHNLKFSTLASSWDEGLPLGNGMLGVLVWQKENKLRLSLDRADLWDDRSVIDFSTLTFKWVREQVINNNYDVVKKYGDIPYEQIPYPTKIPGAALTFNITSLGSVNKNSLDIKTAMAETEWTNGTVFRTFVHAEQNIGVFMVENPVTDFVPDLISPTYKSNSSGQAGNSVEGQSLERLGYAQGTIERTPNTITYYQKGSNEFRYEVSVAWQRKGKILWGVWSISTYSAGDSRENIAFDNCKAAMKSGYKNLVASHRQWWSNFWNRSKVKLPDPQLERQYYLELYKLGCTARKNAPAITLQAIWTADNGKLPPWKGDFHNDLNTQLSYWPAYTSNHLDLAETFTDWLWSIREENKDYTKKFFGVEGLNVPGVTTITGKPMGGWIQYSFSPTISAWLAQHFYWQWKFSNDDSFLKNRAYPYLHDVATFLENITTVENGKRKLPLSSSPEYNDNRITAWFLDYTNYDLSLVKYALRVATEAAAAMGLTDEAAHWKQVADQLPAYDVNETGLTIAPGQNMEASHRHIAQLMALHPLGILNPVDEKQKIIIDKSLRWLEQKGTDYWTGYSFTWAACLFARAHEAGNAVKNLRIFSTNFCLPNSFHVNGDQKGGQYSKFTYRPFTLEGNFAFAQGVHELLIQSHQGFIEIFPAVPVEWKDISFNTLRTEGGFLVSAKKEKGVVTKISIQSDKDATLRIHIPFESWRLEGTPLPAKKDQNGIVELEMKKDQFIIFHPLP